MHTSPPGDRLEANLDAIFRPRGSRARRAMPLLAGALAIGAGVSAWMWHQPRLAHRPAASRPAATWTAPARQGPAHEVAVLPEPPAIGTPGSEAPPAKPAAFAFSTSRLAAPAARAATRRHAAVRVADRAAARADPLPQADDGAVALAAGVAPQAPHMQIDADAISAPEPATVPPPPVAAAPIQEPRAKASHQESLDLIRALRRQ